MQQLRYVRADVISGWLFAVIVAMFIVVTTASTLFMHGFAGQGIDSSEAAARALAPLAWSHASQLFAVGLLGASLLAAAVLPLSTAFVVCEAFGAERSVSVRPRDAPLFLTLFVGLLFGGAAIMLIPGISITGVAIGTQTLDGILLPILLVFILILANDRRLLCRRRNGPVYNAIAFLSRARCRYSRLPGCHHFSTGPHRVTHAGVCKSSPDVPNVEIAAAAQRSPASSAASR